MLGWFSRKLALVPGEGELTKSPTSYYNIARSASNALKGYNVNSDWLKNVCKELLQLNNNELRTVANEYAQNFADRDAPTLRYLIEGELPSWTGACTAAQQNTIDHVCNYQKKTVDRLISIQA